MTTLNQIVNRLYFSMFLQKCNKTENLYGFPNTPRFIQWKEVPLPSITGNETSRKLKDSLESAILPKDFITGTLRKKGNRYSYSGGDDICKFTTGAGILCGTIVHKRNPDNLRSLVLYLNNIWYWYVYNIQNGKITHTGSSSYRDRDVYLFYGTHFHDIDNPHNYRWLVVDKKTGRPHAVSEGPGNDSCKLYVNMDTAEFR